MMLLFGSHFDTDPQYPWTAEILRSEVSAQMHRAEHLYDRTRDYRQKVAGPNDAYTLKALRNIPIFARQPLMIAADDLTPAILGEIARVYPEKAAYVGEDSLAALVREGIEMAQTDGLVDPRSCLDDCADGGLWPWLYRG